MKLSDIYIKNIAGSYNSKSAVTFLCSDAVPCENILLVDINLNYTVPDRPQTARFNVMGKLQGLEVLNSRF